MNARLIAKDVAGHTAHLRIGMHRKEKRDILMRRHEIAQHLEVVSHHLAEALPSMRRQGDSLQSLGPGEGFKQRWPPRVLVEDSLKCIDDGISGEEDPLGGNAL